MRISSVIVSSLVSLIVASASFAQEQREIAIPELRIPRLPAKVVANEVTPGTSGDVILNGSVMPLGVFLRANTSTAHSIGEQLGPSTSAYYSLYTSDGAGLWNVYATGSTILTKDQPGITAMHILNGNPGGTGISAGTAIRFMQGNAILNTALVSLSSASEGIPGPSGFRIWNFVNAAIAFGTNNAERMRIAANGEVTIGTTPEAVRKLTVNGDAHFTGTVTGGKIQAHYQDLAEWVPSREDLAPGTVVVLDPAADNTVVKSKLAYDTTVAGVVSAQPGILLGIPDASKAQIATTGRVKVRVDATAAPIRRGDLLVTAGKPGMAMKSMPVEVGGVAMHRPGTLIGKALEPLESGEGEILVLLSLQ